MNKIIFILIFAAVTATAQTSKTRQVDEALGTRIREIPQPGDRIEYVFQVGRKDVSYYRDGDGVSEYTALLQKTSGMGDYNDEGGTLLFVKKNGDVVARGNASGSIAEQPTARRVRSVGGSDPMRPVSVTQEPIGDGGASFDMPDSMQVADRIDGLKRDITGWKGKLWQAIAPVWDFFMWLFSSVAVFLICCIFIFRYVAKTAANESLVSIYGGVIAGRWIISIQQNAAALTLVCVWFIAVVLLINAFLWMVWANIGLWLMIPSAAVLTFIADKVTDWLVPNLRVAGGGHGRGSGISPY